MQQWPVFFLKKKKDFMQPAPTQLKQEVGKKWVKMGKNFS